METKFESRIGKIEAGDESVYRFITDMRNFKQFIPDGTVEKWDAGEESCSFEVSPVGKAYLSIIDKEEYSTVKYAGDGQNTKFYLWVQLKRVDQDDTRVKLTIKADLNPMLKILASEPVNKFLEKLVQGFESFSDWDSGHDQTQSP